MKQSVHSFRLQGERGQVFMGFIIAMFVVLGLIATVNSYLKNLRRNNEQKIYQEQALMVARMGFEEGLSFFRRNSAGVYLEVGDAATEQQSINSWKMHPDSAFMPQAADTDHYSSLSMAADTADGALSPAAKVTSRAIIRTFPLLTTASNTSTAEMYRSPLWGRFVLRRQNFRNWSPGPNTYNAFTDPEAAHDLSQSRGAARPGAGTSWSLFSRGYVFSNPANVTYNAWFASPALHESSNLLNPLLSSLTFTSKPFLRARASVYGELFRLSFNDQNSAIWAKAGSTITAKNWAVIAGGSSGYAITRGDGSSYVNSSVTWTTAPIVAGSPSIYNSLALAPAISTVFPGLDKPALKKLADRVQGTQSFYAANDPDLIDKTSSVSFIYLTTSSSSSPVSYTAYFLGGTSAQVMTGNGLLFVEGNLDIDKGNYSGWRGLVYVEGNVVIRGPGTITGTLIATGSITLGNIGDNSQAKVEYNTAALQTVRDYLQRFEVLKESIVSTLN